MFTALSIAKWNQQYYSVAPDLDIKHQLLTVLKQVSFKESELLQDQWRMVLLWVRRRF